MLSLFRRRRCSGVSRTPMLERYAMDNLVDAMHVICSQYGVTMLDESQQTQPSERRWLGTPNMLMIVNRVANHYEVSELLTPPVHDMVVEGDVLVRLAPMKHETAEDFAHRLLIEVSRHRKTFQKAVM